MSEQPGASWQWQHIVAGIGLAAAAAVSYCIYFDHKRRSAPDYKQKIRENRRAAMRLSHGSRSGTFGGGRSIPNINNPTEMQAFFLQEVQLGEEMMSEGNIDEGTEHICNAITLCGQPQQLMQIFQQTLPPEHFAMIAQKLPETRARLARLFASVAGDRGETSEGDECSLRPPADLMAGDPQPNEFETIIDTDDLE